VSKQSSETIDELTTRIGQLYYVDKEQLEYGDILSLSQQVLPHQQYYSDITLAKLYLLLTYSASNKSDVHHAYKYSKAGLKITLQNHEVKSGLLLSLAAVYLTRKNFDRLLELSENMVEHSRIVEGDNYNLLALSYRSVAFSMLGNYERSLEDLTEVEQTIDKDRVTIEHIELLSILATAYYYLGDHHTALTIQLKVLKLRFDLGKKENIDKTYIHIGNAYLYLLRFDDAYNAFWEAKKYAVKKEAVISEAHASKGLGISLLKQKLFEEANRELSYAAVIFNAQKLSAEYIESLVGIASAQMHTGNKTAGYETLDTISLLLGDNDLSLEYVGYYRMMAEMNFAQSNYLEAYTFAQKNSQLLLVKFKNKKKEVKYTHTFYNQTLLDLSNKNSSEKTRDIAVKLAQGSELATSYRAKYLKQRNIIIVLFSFITLATLILLFLFFRVRANKSNIAFEPSDNKPSVTKNSSHTKQYYQEIYQKSRKFQYPLTVCLITIQNWQELTFSFNKKRVHEVKNIITHVIQEQLSEYEFAGMLNEGGYLLLFEHQEVKDVEVKIEKLTQALNALFFGNLGDFSVMISYELSSPNFKDIDPFSFLAKLNNHGQVNTANQLKAL
jgi:hypothetical protein